MCVCFVLGGVFSVLAHGCVFSVLGMDGVVSVFCWFVLAATGFRALHHLELLHSGAAAAGAVFTLNSVFSRCQCHLYSN